MTTRRMGLTFFLIVTVALASYGVVTTPEPRPIAEIGTADQFDCALPQDVGAFLASPPPQPSERQRPMRGTIPDGFAPTAALVCDIDLGSRVNADGTATYYERRYEGNFAEAVNAFNAPHTRWSPLNLQCLGDVDVAAPVDIWLIDEVGRAVEPSYPRGNCGLDNTLGLYEVESMPEVSATEHQVRLNPAGILYFYSCSPVAPTPIAGTESLLDEYLFPLGFCEFDTTGPEPAFSGAYRDDNAANLDWNSAIAEAHPAGPCTQQASSVVTTSITGATDENEPINVEIELDGCRRILSDGYTSLSAPVAVLDEIRDTQP